MQSASFGRLVLTANLLETSQELMKNINFVNDNDSGEETANTDFESP